MLVFYACFWHLHYTSSHTLREQFNMLFTLWPKVVEKIDTTFMSVKEQSACTWLRLAKKSQQQGKQSALLRPKVTKPAPLKLTNEHMTSPLH